MYNVKNILRELINKVVDLEDRMYPVGSIYMSVNNVNPSTYFGGTWIQWGSGKVPVGVNVNETEFATVEQSGGEKTHTLTSGQIPSHTHTYDKANANTKSFTLTANEIPAHTHGEKSLTGWFCLCHMTTASTGASGICSKADSTSYKDSYMGMSTLSGQYAHINVNATHTHSSVGGGKGHSHGIATTSTASGGLSNAGNAHNNLQPYITCYMWKRTA